MQHLKHQLLNVGVAQMSWWVSNMLAHQCFSSIHPAGNLKNITICGILRKIGFDMSAQWVWEKSQILGEGDTD